MPRAVLSVTFRTVERPPSVSRGQARDLHNLLGDGVSSQRIFSDLKHAGVAWYGDNATRLASSLAYYTLLSLAPIMVLSVSIAGLVLGEGAARGQIAHEVSRFIGPEADRSVQEVILHAQRPDSGFYGTVVGMGVLFFGASGVFEGAAVGAEYDLEGGAQAGARRVG